MSEFPPRGTLSVSYGEACDRGKVREENQDSIRSAAIPLGDLFIVADGIGGYQGGATASRMVAEGFLAQLAALPANYPADHALAEACTYTNASIHAAANTGDPAFQRMGSTVVLALVQPGGAAGGNSGEVASFGPNAWIGHVGDSRAYLIRGGQMTKITNDHSAVQALINRNLITEEEARNHPDASVLTRSLGHRPDVEIEIDRVPLQFGDSLLLCSDGLWGYVADADIAAVATDPNLSVEKIAQYLLDLALTAGGHDNIGIEFLRIGGSSAAFAPPVPNPSRTALRSTVPSMGAVPMANGAATASGFAPPDEPARSHRRQIVIAVCLLALAIGGALGVFFRGWKNHTSDNTKTNTAQSGGESTPRQPGGGGKPTKPAGTQPSKPPSGTAADAKRPKLIGIVGEIELGPLKPLAPGEIATQRATIRHEARQSCVNLATGEPVVYVNKPDLSQHAIVEAVLESYPDVESPVKAPEIKRKNMTPDVRKACGDKYDAVIILAAKAPAGATPNPADPRNKAPRPVETQDGPAAHLAHPAGPQEF